MSVVPVGVSAAEGWVFVSEAGRTGDRLDAQFPVEGRKTNAVSTRSRRIVLVALAVLLLVGGADEGRAQPMRMLATLPNGVDLEVGGTSPPTYDCPPGEYLYEWRLYQADELYTSSYDIVATIPPTGPFPWRKRILQWGAGQWTFELTPVCAFQSVLTAELPVAWVTVDTGTYSGTFYFDTHIRFDWSDPNVGAITVMSEPECFSGGTVSGPCWPELTIEGVNVEASANLSAQYAKIYMLGSRWKGNIEVYGSSLTVYDSWITGYLQSRSYSAFGGPFTGSTVVIEDSWIDQVGPVFSFDESSVQLLGSKFRGQGVPVIGRILRSDTVEIRDSKFLDARHADPGVRADFLEIGCLPSGCGCEFVRNQVASFGDDLVFRIGDSPCDVSGNTLRNTRLEVIEGHLELTGNDVFWTAPPDGAVVMLSVGPSGTVRDNIIRGVGVTGLVTFGDAANFIVSGNSFCVPFPGGYGLQNTALGTLDATGNYWGHPTGPRPTGLGSFVLNSVDYVPFSTSGSCGSVFIEKLELVQGVATTNLVAGKPVVLRVFLGNDGSEGVTGVSITGTMGGKRFAVSGLHVPPEYNWAEIHDGEDSVNIVDLPLPVEGPGEVRVRLHYLDPDLGFPVTQERTLAYTGSTQRALKIGAVAAGVPFSDVEATFKKELPLLRSLYPTHRVMVFRPAALASLSSATGALAQMWAASKYSDLDVFVGVAPDSALADFDAGWGGSVLIWSHQSYCAAQGTLGVGGESTFVLSHAVAHGLIGAADEHKPDNPSWNDTDFPHGPLVESGWDVFRGKAGLIHSYDPDDLLATCALYTPGETSHLCNFYDLMATQCLPPKWIGPGLRSSLFQHLVTQAPTSSPAPGITAVAKTEVSALAIPVTVWEDGAGRLEGLFDLVATPSDSEAAGGWTVATLDGSGSVLAQASFSAAFRDTDPDRGLRFGGAGVILPAGPQVAEVVLLRGPDQVDSISRDGGPPQVTVLSPNGGETLSGAFTASWSASDPDSDPLTFAAMVRCAGDDGWIPVAFDVTATSVGLDTADFPGGDSCELRIVAADGKWSSSDDSDSSFSIAKHPPEVEIVSPAEGGSFDAGTEVTLTGLASDLDGDELAAPAYVWTSDRDGPLGSGPNLTVNGLSLGGHVLTLTVTDSGGLQGSASVSIAVDLAADSDHDDLPDWWEALWGTQLGVDDHSADPDVDGLTNAEELAHGTDPLTADSDSDGWLDGEEVAAGTDPLDPRDNPWVLLIDGFETGNTSRWSKTIP